MLLRMLSEVLLSRFFKTLVKNLLDFDTYHSILLLCLFLCLNIKLSDQASIGLFLLDVNRTILGLFFIKLTVAYYLRLHLIFVTTKIPPFIRVCIADIIIGWVDIDSSLISLSKLVRITEFF
jgi:hypothetical protein